MTVSVTLSEALRFSFTSLSNSEFIGVMVIESF